jgi:hypothetical protein
MRLFGLGSAPSADPSQINMLATLAKESLELKIPSERIAFHDSVQHLSVRDEEQYQSSLRSLHKHQQEAWFPGLLIPSNNNQEKQEQLRVYLLLRDEAHKVGRLRNSMVSQVFSQLKHELKINERVVPIIGKVIPGSGKQAFTVLAYARTDLVQFPVY